MKKVKEITRRAKGGQQKELDTGVKKKQFSKYKKEDYTTAIKDFLAGGGTYDQFADIAENNPKLLKQMLDTASKKGEEKPEGEGTPKTEETKKIINQKLRKMKTQQITTEKEKGNSLVGKKMSIEIYGKKTSKVIKSIQQEEEGGQYKIKFKDDSEMYINDFILNKLLSGKEHNFPNSPYSDDKPNEKISVNTKHNY